MFHKDQYQLLDFGKGRKLERFGPWVLDRPSPAAEGVAKAAAASWSSASARYERGEGEFGTWRPKDTLPASWTIRHGSLVFELKATEFGHLGIFPEQAANWDWIARQVERARRPLKVLNLFAYTGGSTLAAAAAGAEVVHVDAARNTVNWARRNAALSGLEAAPIRWIAEDAVKFVRRELKRGNGYDVVMLDPPSYGHGPAGEVWKINEHLLPLLEACGRLTEGRRAFLLLSCHAPGIGPAELSAYLADAVFGHCGAGGTASELTMEAADGRRLPAGVVARWPG
jgi:23S rRNA (cytosine1962-C5)-methyltransferase